MSKDYFKDFLNDGVNSKYYRCEKVSDVTILFDHSYTIYFDGWVKEFDLNKEWFSYKKDRSVGVSKEDFDIWYLQKNRDEKVNLILG